MKPDWTGFNVARVSANRGTVVCALCGETWSVPVCWINKPPDQCQAIIDRHRRECRAVQYTRVEAAT